MLLAVNEVREEGNQINILEPKKILKARQNDLEMPDLIEANIAQNLDELQRSYMRKFDHNAISNKDIYFDDYVEQPRQEIAPTRLRSNIKTSTPDILGRKNSNNSSKLILNIKLINSDFEATSSSTVD